MKKAKLILSAALVFCAVLLLAQVVFSQTVEEKAEKALDVLKLRKVKPAQEVYNSAGVFFGYDSNAKLTADGKGAYFEETLYSFAMISPLKHKMNLIFNYDLDYQNYNDNVTATNMLNHLRLELNKKFYRYFRAGTGYDFSYAYYQNDADGDFFFHKGFLYLRQYLTRNLYQQIFAEYGYKPHLSRKAIGDALSVDQDKKEEEHRQTIGYRVNFELSRAINLDFKTRFYKNNANDRYQDYYDYKAYEFSPGVNWRPTARIEAYLNFIYLQKDYKTRTVFDNPGEKEQDDIYAVNASLRYRLFKNTILSLIYGYRNNNSNDSLQKYNENIVNLGCQYNF